MRKYYWYLSTFLKKHGLVLLLSVLGAVLFFSVTIPLLASNLNFKKRTFIGIIGSYSITDLPPEIKAEISTGLTKIQPDGSTVPSLAERMIVENDGTTYRFLLKKDIKWHDGITLKPADINFNFNDTEIITNQNEVIFNLPTAYSPFPVTTAEPVIKMGEQRHLLFLTRPIPIGIGDYKVSDYKQTNGSLTQLILDSKDERLIYRFYSTEDEAVVGFKRGEVDVLPDLTSTHDLDTWPNTIATPSIGFDKYLGVFFNNSLPIFNKNIRQALAYALPKPMDDTRATSPISPNSWAYLESVKTYDLDLERAVDRAIAEIPPEKIDFTLTTTTQFQDQAKEIKQAWEEFGVAAQAACNESDQVEDKARCANLAITVNLRITNFPNLNDYQALLIGQEIPPDPDQYSLWHSDQTTNFTNYKNTRIDALLERGRTTTDQVERKAIYQEFQQFFLEDSPVIFLKYLTSYQIERG